MTIIGKQHIGCTIRRHGQSLFGVMTLEGVVATYDENKEFPIGLVPKGGLEYGWYYQSNDTWGHWEVVAWPNGKPAEKRTMSFDETKKLKVPFRKVGLLSSWEWTDTGLVWYGDEKPVKLLAADLDARYELVPSGPKEATVTMENFVYLFDVLAHGNDGHRQWLKEEITKFAKGLGL